jgi:hypothetical protein
LCASIRYETRNDPKQVTICYCKFCQRATGAAGFIEPIFLDQDFHITRGTPKVYQQRSGGSGKMIGVHFCGACGTKIHLSFERFPGVVGVYAGTFDDPGWFDIRAGNSKHIFLDEALDGTIIPAGFVTYRRHASTNDGKPCEPTVFDAPHVVGTRRRAG